jgi:hypothetical protein
LVDRFVGSHVGRGVGVVVKRETSKEGKREREMKPSIEMERKAMRVDRRVIIVSKYTDESDEKTYWLSRTPEERLRHAEILRRMNYGHRATERLSRILEIVKRPWG